MSSEDLIRKSTADFMTYAAAVIKGRAIPSVEDQLKPVHRRILYTMAINKLWSKAKFMKVSKVVGDVMGKFHPHGDASINDALVRLSQDWKMRYPLVDIHGNNGSVGGDMPAAGRYIECKLTPLGDSFLENTEEGIVPFIDNYDGTEREPVYLGGIFPNILCNGTEGIAVGMSCSLLPHNLNEVVELLCAVAEGKVSSIEEAMTHLKGPDFPLGGIVVDGYKLPEIYRTGQGAITVRAKSEIQGNRITFTEFPYGVEVENQILKAIKKMRVEDGYEDIEDTENHMGKDGCSIVVICRKTANIKKVLNDLYDNTPLAKTVKINQTVIYKGVPITLNLMGLCSYYLHHQHNIFKNKANIHKDKSAHVQKINEGYLKAILNIDETVRIIRNASSKDEANKQLVTALNIDSEQADAILKLQLGRLTKLDTHEIEQKIATAKEEVSEQNKIITNTTYRVSLICKELRSIAERFGDARRTTIIMDQPDPDTGDTNTGKDDMGIILNDGTLITLAANEVETAFKKGGQYSKYQPIAMIPTEGKEVRVVVADGTTATSAEMGKPANLMVVDASKEYVVTVSRKGWAKRTAMAQYKKFDKLSRVKAEDEIIFAVCCNGNDRIAAVQDSGKVVGIAVSELKESNKLTLGGKVFDGVRDVALVTEYMFTRTTDGHVKRFKGEEITSNSSMLNDDCVQMGSCFNKAFYDCGKIVALDWASITVKSKTAIGAKLGTKQIVKIF